MMGAARQTRVDAVVCPASQNPQAAVPESRMPTITSNQILNEIEALPSDDLTRLCNALVAILPRLTGGAFEVRPGREMRAMRSFFRMIMRREGGRIGTAGVRVVEEVLVTSHELTRLASEAAGHAKAYRTENAVARAKEDRRRRRPTELTTRVMRKVADLVADCQRRGKQVSWPAVAAQIHVEFGRKYAPTSLKAMFHRGKSAGRPVATPGAGG
jgi:hypothetical protein